MGFGSTAGGGGVLAMLFAAGSMFRSDEPVAPVIEKVTDDGGVFVPWALDDRSIMDEGVEPDPECVWNNGSVTYQSEFCAHFSLSRLASSTATKALDRASRCAAAFETECVLSAEIGVSLPAAFIHDGGNGMKMIIAPRIINGNDIRNVKVEDPTGKTTPRLVLMNFTLEVEFLLGGSRVPMTETFSGSDAFCIQLLRRSFVSECWDSLD